MAPTDTKLQRNLIQGRRREKKKRFLSGSPTLLCGSSEVTSQVSVLIVDIFLPSVSLQNIVDPCQTVVEGNFVSALFDSSFMMLLQKLKTGRTFIFHVLLFHSLGSC